MNLHNVTATQSNGKKIASVMFAGDHFSLIERVNTMETQHQNAIIEGFTYTPGGGWVKSAGTVPTLELKFEDVELWNYGRNWIVMEGKQQYHRNNEKQARQVLCEMLGDHA